MYNAHINLNRIQSCNEHSRNTAQYASNDLKNIGLGNLGYLCGLLHDTGKYSKDFQIYLEKSVKGENVAKGSVIHTFAGVRLVLSRYHSLYNGGKSWGDLGDITAELIAFGIGSHHGLFDIFDFNGSGFEHRLKKQPDFDDIAISNYINECADTNEIDELFLKSEKEVELFIENSPSLFSDNSNPDADEANKEMLFYIGSLGRMLLSAVIDGDRRDTSEFMSDNCLEFHDYSEMELSSIWDKAHSGLLRLINSFDADSNIKQARREMSDYCEKFANNPGDIYRLNLPTGAGKTLSGLRYALIHAKKYKKKRIIFAVPLLSVLDQNAGVIREAIDNDGIILEHHSNVIIENDSEEALQDRDLMTEKWNSPVIITTLVQLLNTMFDGKTSCIRRFQSLANSVIVIDEVQSVPVKMLSLFNLMLDFLAKACGTTFVLCSATQPLLEMNSHKLLVSSKQMIPLKKMQEYKQIFKRNTVEYAGEEDVEGINKRILEYLNNCGSVLVIVNTKKEAAEIYKELRDRMDGSYTCRHLSTSMCMKHRKKVLSEVLEALGNHERIVCISTQLIEAGVDASFGAVIRLTAGIDNVMQAAGRCNRNGEQSAETAKVCVVSLNGENISRLEEIKMQQDVTGELISEYVKAPEKFDHDLLSDKATNYYYERLFSKFNAISGHTEFSIDENNLNLLDLLSYNTKFAMDAPPSLTMRQAFKTAGRYFKVFDSEQISVIVPYGEKGESIIADILSYDSIYNNNNKINVLRSAKEYTVNLFKYQMDQLFKMNGVYTDRDGTVLILNKDFYDDNMGIIFREEKIEWNTLIL